MSNVLLQLYITAGHEPSFEIMHESFPVVQQPATQYHLPGDISVINSSLANLRKG